MQQVCRWCDRSCDYEKSRLEGVAPSYFSRRCSIAAQHEMKRESVRINNEWEKTTKKWDSFSNATPGFD